MRMNPWLLVGLAVAVAASAQPLELLPVVGVGKSAPPPSVRQKVGQLLAASLERARGTAAAATVDAAAARVAAARTKYFDLDFKGALAEARAAITHYEAHPEHVGAGQGWVDAHIYAA